MKKIELLSPAGDFRSLVAGVKAGADAIYFGLEEFNMRESARNFKISDLAKIRKIAGNKKLYLTLNTIIYDNELVRLEKILRKVKGKVDAVICWDLSVIELCRKLKIPFHVSTQASVSNKKAAEFYKRLGAKRIVLARELDLKQIKAISRVIDTEVFGHGAMCVSVSGRCFTSQFLHCKSANRGECRHPCRKSYIVRDDKGNELRVENSRIFSAKDLCTLPFIEKIKRAGVSAIKIEGRNREPEYVYTTTKIYREAIDRKLNEKEIQDRIKELEKVYNREFSSGFYFKTPGEKDFTNEENGSAKENKEYVGKVMHYWKNLGVAALKMHAGKLEVGDDILVLGKTTFIKEQVKSMQINHKNVNQARKGESVAIKIGLCRENDEVYVIKEKA